MLSTQGIWRTKGLQPISEGTPLSQVNIAVPGRKSAYEESQFRVQQSENRTYQDGWFDTREIRAPQNIFPTRAQGDILLENNQHAYGHGKIFDCPTVRTARYTSDGIPLNPSPYQRPLPTITQTYYGQDWKGKPPAPAAERAARSVAAPPPSPASEDDMDVDTVSESLPKDADLYTMSEDTKSDRDYGDGGGGGGDTTEPDTKSDRDDTTVTDVAAGGRIDPISGKGKGMYHESVAERAIDEAIVITAEKMIIPPAPAPLTVGTVGDVEDEKTSTSTIMTDSDEIRKYKDDLYQQLLLIGNLKIEIAALQNKLDEHKKTSKTKDDHWKDKDEDYRRTIKVLSDDLAEMEAKKNKLTNEITGYEARQLESVEKIATLEEINRSLEAKIEKSNQDFINLSNSLSEGNEALTSLKELHKEEIAKLTNAKNEIESIWTGLLQKKSEENSKVIQSYSEKRFKLETQISTLNAELSSVTDQLKTANAKNETNIKTIQDYETQIAGLQQQLKDNSDKAQATLNELSNLNAGLNATYRQLVTNYGSLESEYGQYKAEVQPSIDLYVTKTNRLEKEVLFYQNQVAELTDQLSEIKAELQKQVETGVSKEQYEKLNLELVKSELYRKNELEAYQISIAEKDKAVYEKGVKFKAAVNERLKTLEIDFKTAQQELLKTTEIDKRVIARLQSELDRLIDEHNITAQSNRALLAANRSLKDKRNAAEQKFFAMESAKNNAEIKERQAFARFMDLFKTNEIMNRTTPEAQQALIKVYTQSDEKAQETELGKVPLDVQQEVKKVRDIMKQELYPSLRTTDAWADYLDLGQDVRAKLDEVGPKSKELNAIYARYLDNTATQDDIDTGMVMAGQAGIAVKKATKQVGRQQVGHKRRASDTMIQKVAKEQATVSPSSTRERDYIDIKNIIAESAAAYAKDQADDTVVTSLSEEATVQAMFKAIFG